MKRKILMMAVALGALTATGLSQTTFGIRAGVNFQNLNGEDGSGNDLNNKLRTGFNAGVNAEIPIADEFYIQPGILYSLKGAKADNSDAKVGLSYLEVPINFIYKPELGSGKLVLGFGPYAGYAVSGKYEDGNGNDGDIEFENNISPLQAVSGVYLKRFDAGANLLFGYEFSNKLSIQANAGLGLVNILPDVDGVNSDAKTKNTGFGISLGYRF